MPYIESGAVVHCTIFQNPAAPFGCLNQKPKGLKMANIKTQLTNAATKLKGIAGAMKQDWASQWISYFIELKNDLKKSKPDSDFLDPIIEAQIKAIENIIDKLGSSHNLSIKESQDYVDLFNPLVDSIKSTIKTAQIFTKKVEKDQLSAEKRNHKVMGLGDRIKMAKSMSENSL